jgi:hypothetical protein
MATGRKFLAAIERRTLVMPTLYDLEYATWEDETKAGLADMDAANRACQQLDPVSLNSNWQEFEAHRTKFRENHKAFDRAQARIDAANKRWERFKDA